MTAHCGALVVATAAATLGGVAATVLLRRTGRPEPGPATATTVTAGHRGGSGSPVLLLHGVGGTWHAWLPVLPHLEPHHEVFAPTLLGHGGAERLADGVAPSVDAFVDGVEAELDRAGLDTVHVVGNSLGGWVAIELARRGRARSLTLFSPAGAWQSRRRITAVAATIRLSVAALARFSAHADVIVARPWLRRALLSTQVAYPDRVDPASLADNIRASADAPGVGPFLRVVTRLHLDPLPARTCPVRVVWAEPDRVIPFRHFGEPMLERLPGAELIRMRGIGHVPMSDDPAGVARMILEVTAAVDRAALSTGDESR